ncbi:MAG: hypothetical protein CVT96_03455 [Bacteroidetes bacterium HGW-Bacteroidetes-13]|nr:MAG: hypothetical protein CVT96_03455 [Bacteroidetes bacterium HGW-Bacteroidetes-13]
MGIIKRNRTQDSGNRTQETGLRKQDSGNRTQETGLRKQDSGLRTQDSGIFIIIWSLVLILFS